MTRVGIDDWARHVADGRESKHRELARWLDVNVHGRLTLAFLITLTLQPLLILITFMSLHASANYPVVCRLTRFCRYLLTALLHSELQVRELSVCFYYLAIVDGVKRVKEGVVVWDASGRETEGKGQSHT